MDKTTNALLKGNRGKRNYKEEYDELVYIYIIKYSHKPPFLFEGIKGSDLKDIVEQDKRVLDFLERDFFAPRFRDFILGANEAIDGGSYYMGMNPPDTSGKLCGEMIYDLADEEAELERVRHELRDFFPEMVSRERLRRLLFGGVNEKLYDCTALRSRVIRSIFDSFKALINCEVLYLLEIDEADMDLDEPERISKNTYEMMDDVLDSVIKPLEEILLAREISDAEMERLLKRS